MAKIKNENRQFSSAPIALINDDTIPDRARFIYVYMNAKPEGWEFFHEPMAKALKIGVDTLKKYIDILIDRGWLEKGDQQNENGKFGPVEYTLKAFRKRTSNKNTDTEKYRNGKIPQQYINSSNDSTINDNNCTMNSSVNNKEEKIILSDDNKKSDDLFNLIWKKYKKGSKKAALKAWNKLKDKQKELALNNVDAYLVFCKRSGRPLKDVSTYLNGECFNDDWSAIPECYQVDEFIDSERIQRFKRYMVSKFPDLIYHRNPLTFEQCDELFDEYGVGPFEEAMKRLCGRDIHQYYSIKSGVEHVLKEVQDDNI